MRLTPEQREQLREWTPYVDDFFPPEEDVLEIVLENP